MDRGSPQYVLITSVANIHLNEDHRRTTITTNEKMSNLGLYDAFRTIQPDKQTHPGYTFPARDNTENNHTRIDRCTYWGGEDRPFKKKSFHPKITINIVLHA